MYRLSINTLLFLISIFTLNSYAAKPSTQGNVNDFLAPVLYDKSTIPAPQAGLIVFDLQDNTFYGRTAANSWSAMSTITDHVMNSSSTLTAFPIPVYQWGDLGSISLPAGEWDISAQVVFYSNGVTTSDQVHVGISSTSGNSNSGLAQGDNMVMEWKDSINGSYDTLTIAAYRVSHTSTTNYYLKSYVGGSVSNLEIVYRISARRVK